MVKNSGDVWFLFQYWCFAQLGYGANRAYLAPDFLFHDVINANEGLGTWFQIASEQISTTRVFGPTLAGLVSILPKERRRSDELCEYF